MSQQNNIRYSFNGLTEHGAPTKMAKISEKREVSGSEVRHAQCLGTLSAFT